MAKHIKTINGCNIFTPEYDEKFKGKGEKISGIEAKGMSFIFAEWYNTLKGENVTTPRKIWNNTSEIRDKNRIAFYEPIEFTDDLSIPYMYLYNNTVWIALYSHTEYNIIGEIELLTPYLNIKEKTL